MRIRRLLLLSLFPLLWLIGCKPGRPDGVLPDQKMEDVLYDYHIAVNLASGQATSGDAETEIYAAEEAVFRRHRVTRRQFENSLRYYTVHTDEFYEIYDRLALRYGVGPLGQPDAASGAGDALDVWVGRNCWLLVSPGVNRRSFEIEADTVFQPDDEIIWNFTADWFYKEGTKNAVASLSLRYANDSTSTVMQYVFSSGRQNIVMRTDSRQKLSKITGFIYQVAPWSELPHLLVVSDISLTCRHQEPAPDTGVASSPADTLEVATSSSEKSDTLLRKHDLPSGERRLPPKVRVLFPEEHTVKLQPGDVRPLRRQTREQAIRDSLLGEDRRRGIINRSRR